MTRKQQFERLINEKFKSKDVPIVHITTTELAGQMGLSQPAISMSVKRGAGIVKAEKLSIDDLIT